MTDDKVTPSNPDGDPAEIDTEAAHAVRVYNYLLGGPVHFAADRQAAEQVFSAFPGGEKVVRAAMREHQAFLSRAVRYLIDQGIRQFLDIGTGVPSEDSVHEVAQRAAPESRILYVEQDPIVLAHAHELLQSTPEGATGYVQADPRDPTTILREAAATLDFTQPVAVMLSGVLHFLSTDDDPYGIVGKLVQAVPSGSYLLISHLASDIIPEGMADAVGRLNQVSDKPIVPRNHAEVSKFFDGLELIEPGVGPIDEWQQTPREKMRVAFHCGLGRKP
jgi:hypothetical protein